MAADLGGQLPADAIVSDIQFQPDDDRTILPATQHGVFRSDDGGRRWRFPAGGCLVAAERLALARSRQSGACRLPRTTVR